MLNRIEIAGRLERIRHLRNRIAHHEPILHYSVESEFNEILEAIGWVCPVTVAWVESTSTLPERFKTSLISN
jgi:hypothetical protein